MTTEGVRSLWAILLREVRSVRVIMLRFVCDDRKGALSVGNPPPGGEHCEGNPAEVL